jgi:hypothetical protein
MTTGTAADILAIVARRACGHSCRELTLTNRDPEALGLVPVDVLRG